MLGNKKRLFIAFILSVTSLSLTLIWYYLFDPNQSESGQFVVAVVESVKNEVTKRPAERLIWQTVESGDGIRHGETIRTRNESEMKIKFIDGPELKIEPDTLVVITRNEDKIALELVEGGLLSSQVGETQNQFLLKSQGGDFDLSKSKVKVSKSKGETLKLNVLKGNVEIEGTGKVIESGQTLKIEKTGEKTQVKNLELLSPDIEQTLFINKGENVLFRWADQKEISDVQLFVGDTRENLKKVDSLNTLKNTLSFQFKEGAFWVQLKGFKNKQVIAESAIHFLDIKYFQIPNIIYPSLGERILNQKEGINFLWSHPSFVEQVHLVVKDIKNNKLIIDEKLKPIEYYLSPFFQEGDYEVFVRIKYPRSEVWIESKRNTFSVAQDKPKEPVIMTWLEKDKLLQQEYPVNPQINLAWEGYKGEEIHRYEIEIISDDNTIDRKEIDSTQVKYQGQLPKYGYFTFKLRALDKNKNIIAISEPLQIEIKQNPLLNEVQFSEKSKTILSNREGEVLVSWLPLEGALNYELILTDKKNKILKKEKIKNTSYLLTDLMPGEYQLKVYGIDRWNRTGTESDGVLIQVPEVSGIRAPATKKVKIK